ncbi:Uncharacterised protein [Mycobacterium tuberculosis]|uniref:Uncharacterized protein n=1 Tax=Mycobacterium tuberculosis TaxID=1773 RepID=A0A655IE51_MYCTX|nr:Uncharacterised protein [Mycobacterium tuberculosis]COV81670.1 Uncharacterised protein [Mycobacterium tuberculosis]COW82921.1 Uncharacterised protein [Mycobacterium tuberculosis]
MSASMRRAIFDARLSVQTASGSVLISIECTVLAESRARADAESPKIQDFEAILRLLAQPGELGPS